MCGIVGYAGSGEAQRFLLEGLEKLEYRGYDSAGLAISSQSGVIVRKTAGRLERLAAELGARPVTGITGIGHTRWATHGEPTTSNAHPHLDCDEELAVVHNGIIENHAALRDELKSRGHVFRSATDTEVLAHLVEESYARCGDLQMALAAALEKVRGAYAIAVISRREPGKIVAARLSCPLVLGFGDGENLLASDIPALLARTRRIQPMKDGELAVLTCERADIFDREGRTVTRSNLVVDWEPGAADRGGYPHFMLKEIEEQPRALADTLRGRLDAARGRVNLDEALWEPGEIQALRQVRLVACGTAYHAALIGAELIERWARLPARAELASEFRYRDPLVDSGTLLVAVSQSGETADTLAALAEGKRRGAGTLGVTNVLGSTLAREGGRSLLTRAGPEIAVASTKAYTTQVLVLTLLALYLAQERGRPLPAGGDFWRELRGLPELATKVLAGAEAIRREALAFAAWSDVFFIGRGTDYPVAQEGQLKLKEISYLHAEAYAAGELKHGTLALIENGVPVVALVTQRAVREKTLSNILEVKARGARVYGVIRENDAEAAGIMDWSVSIPAVSDALTPALAVIPLQLLAYHAAVARGCDVDKPRNLAKSVTVE